MRTLSSLARAAIIEALAAALVEDYLEEQQQLTKAADDSPTCRPRRQSERSSIASIVSCSTRTCLAECSISL
jgi:hypothetical protein